MQIIDKLVGSNLNNARFNCWLNVIRGHTDRYICFGTTKYIQIPVVKTTFDLEAEDFYV